MLFFAFKASYVRQPIHEIIGAAVLLMVAFLLVIQHRNYGERILVFVAVALFVFTFNTEVQGSFRTFLNEWRSQLARSADGVVSLMRDRGSYQRRFEADMKVIGIQRPLPKVEGDADYYSYHQTEVFANQIPWNPRPVFQSYSAYTAELAKRNADHLVGDHAPKNLFFRVEPIEDRYPAMEDGLSWPLILCRYELAGTYSWGLHYVKALAPKHFHIVPLKEFEARLGEEIVLPGEKPLIWAEISIPRSATERVLEFLFRPPLLRIEVQLAGGQKQNLRYLARVGEAGFLISPFIASTDDFRTLTVAVQKGSGLPSAVRSFRIMEEKGWLVNGYNGQMHVKLGFLQLE